MSKIVTELQGLTPDELAAKVVELKTEMVEKQRALKANELNNPYVIKYLRRKIAVALTLINQKPVPAAEAPSTKVKEEEA